MPLARLEPATPRSRVKLTKFEAASHKMFQDIFITTSALDKLLGQLGIYATWLSSIAHLQKQLRIFIFFLRHVFFSVITPFLIA